MVLARHLLRSVQVLSAPFREERGVVMSLHATGALDRGFPGPRRTPASPQSFTNARGDVRL